MLGWSSLGGLFQPMAVRGNSAPPRGRPSDMVCTYNLVQPLGVWCGSPPPPPPPATCLPPGDPSPPPRWSPSLPHPHHPSSPFPRPPLPSYPLLAPWHVRLSPDPLALPPIPSSPFEGEFPPPLLPRPSTGVDRVSMRDHQFHMMASPLGGACRVSQQFRVVSVQ